MLKLKYVLFDIGGVLMLDFSKTNKWEIMKRDIGIKKENDRKFEKIWDEYTERVNLDYDVDSLIPVLEKEFGLKFKNNYSLLDDLVRRFEANSHLHSLVYKIRDEGELKLGLLTNMYPRMLNKIRENKLIPSICWDIILDSSILGVQKPDKEIYRFAEIKMKIKRYQIFFVDNLENNLIYPNKMGWKTFLYNPANPKKSAEELESLIYG